MPDNPLDRFLTPEAMLTPGAAGGITMMITNALGVNFSMPRAWTALGLSFAFGMLVLVADKGLIAKGVYYLLNSLVIFCVAMGTNSVGAQARLQGSSISAIGSAFAQSASDPSTAIDALSKLTDQYNAVSKQLDAARQNPAASKDDVANLAAQLQEINAKRSDVMSSIITKLREPAELGPKNEPRSIGKSPFFKPWQF